MLLIYRSAKARVLLALLACALLAAVAVSASARPNAAARSSQAPQPQQYEPDDNFTANWTRADALKVRLDPTNTKPAIPADFPVMTDEVWVWDTWPLTGLGMKPISYKGWNVIFSLVAPRDIGFDARHEVATIGYFFSRRGGDTAARSSLATRHGARANGRAPRCSLAPRSACSTRHRATTRIRRSRIRIGI
jgi:hypothetical protein